MKFELEQENLFSSKASSNDVTTAVYEFMYEFSCCSWSPTLLTTKNTTKKSWAELI